MIGKYCREMKCRPTELLMGCYAIIVIFLCGEWSFIYGFDVDKVFLLRTTGEQSQSKNPLSPSSNETARHYELLSRGALEMWATQGLKLEFNGYLTYGYQTKSEPSASTSLSNESSAMTIWRSSILQESYLNSHNRYGDGVVDRINLSMEGENTVVKIGRQPINLSVTSIFTPNDVFQPFQVDEFYRLYKPGVDGVRLSHHLSEVSFIELIMVQGYKIDSEHVGEYSEENKPDGSRSAAILKAALGSEYLDIHILTGKVAGENFAGLGMQASIGSFYLRAEGYHSRSARNWEDIDDQFTLSLNHQIGADSQITFEKYYNGRGYRSRFQYWQILRDDTPPRLGLGTHYSGLSLVQQWSPLIAGQYLIIANESDGSQLLSLFHNYSLSNESDIALTLSKGFGKTPAKATLNLRELAPSEYGVITFQALLAINHYF